MALAISMESPNFLGDGLIEHIQVADFAYAEYVERKVA